MNPTMAAGHYMQGGGGQSNRYLWAKQSYPQVAAESPLLWILFYDMVLCQLQREDVGKWLTLAVVAGEQMQAGLSAFADDAAFLSRVDRR
jgi:hypothetical protein